MFPFFKSERIAARETNTARMGRPTNKRFSGQRTRDFLFLSEANKRILELNEKKNPDGRMKEV